MAKRKKPTKTKSWQARRLNRPQINVGREAEYIVMRAQRNDSRVVGINQLILFSTMTGDAWNAQYRIEGEAFIVWDQSGRIRTIMGYPTDEIMKHA